MAIISVDDYRKRLAGGQSGQAIQASLRTKPVRTAGLSGSGGTGVRIPPIPTFTGTAKTTTAAGGTGGAGGSAGAGLPPELTKLNINATAPKELTSLAGDYEAQRKAVQEGRSREADVFNEGLASDMERQIAAAKEQALSEGRPFDEPAMRAELTRSGNKAKAEFALGTQKEALAATREGLDVAKAPFEAEMAAKGLSLETQKLLSDYALGRGGLMNDAERNEISRQAQAIDAYKAMLEALRTQAALS